MDKIKEILLLMALLLACGCSEYDTDDIDTQRTKIVSFLTSTHSPKLIAEEDVEDSAEYQPEFYTTSGNTVYRYISDYYNTERADKAEVMDGSTIWITFWCYDFSTYATPSSSYLLYTNDPLYEDAYIEAGLNTEYWDFSPQRIVLGEGDILKSIETALVGCREGDSVELYMTYNMAYGNNWVGLSTLQSAFAFFCTIDSIEN